MKTTGTTMWKKVRGPAIGIATTAALLVLVLLPSAATAATLAGNSNTYLQSREDAANNKYLPVYEYLDLSVQDLGTETVSAHLGGWMGLDLTNNSSFGDRKKSDSDLQYGYVSYRAKANNAVVNMGRVMVFEGVAAERIDGIYARTDIKGGFGIAAFGGSPVETGDITTDNKSIFGGRISHQNAGLYTLGLSYLKEDKDSGTFRQEEGVDLWLRPVNKVELMGRSSYNGETKNWMEHAYFLVLGPFADLRFNTEASMISYGDYFAGSTSNVFRLTPGGLLDPKEKVNILGEEVVYTINKNWTASVDYKGYSYDLAGSASYYGAKVTYSAPKSYAAGLTIHKMDGDTNRLKYDEYRIYASKKIDKVDVALDLLDVKYKEPINDVKNAYSAAIAAGYELMHNLRLGLDIEYSKNPDFDKDVRAFAKVVYNFDVGGGSHAPAAPTAAGAEKAAAPVETKPAAPAEAAAQPAAAAPAAEQGKPKEGN